MVLSLVLAACAPAVVEKEDEDVTTPTDKDEDVVEEEVQEEEVVEEKEMVTDVVGRLVEKPQYGGTINLGRYDNPTHWGPHISTYPLSLQS